MVERGGAMRVTINALVLQGVEATFAGRVLLRPILEE